MSEQVNLGTQGAVIASSHELDSIHGAGLLWVDSHFLAVWSYPVLSVCIVKGRLFVVMLRMQRGLSRVRVGEEADPIGPDHFGIEPLRPSTPLNAASPFDSLENTGRQWPRATQRFSTPQVICCTISA